jgi:uncharacterized cupredoxin-like copper-binding protein
MKKCLMAMALAALGTTAMASGSHEGGHEGESLAGEPGQKAKVTQTIQITMKETDDGKMLYIPDSIQVKEGQTVRFAIRNSGEADHEFVLDTQEEVMEHKQVMEKFPEMEHEDPNSVRLAPGRSGEIIWKFTKSGTLTFACLIPGHYEAGMRGDVSVTAKN